MRALRRGAPVHMIQSDKYVASSTGRLVFNVPLVTGYAGIFLRFNVGEGSRAVFDVVPSGEQDVLGNYGLCHFCRRA